MSKMEQEIQEVMADQQAKELAQALMNHFRYLPTLKTEEREAIVRILEDVIKDLPVYQAIWIAFRLGCAWQNLKD